jgi:hypothetical protein
LYKSEVSNDETGSELQSLVIRHSDFSFSEAAEAGFEPTSRRSKRLILPLEDSAGKTKKQSKDISQTTSKSETQNPNDERKAD